MQVERGWVVAINLEASEELLSVEGKWLCWFSDNKGQYFPKPKFDIQNKSNFMEQCQVLYFMIPISQPSNSITCLSSLPGNSILRLQLWQARVSHYQLHFSKVIGHGNKELLAASPSKPPFLVQKLAYAQMTIPRMGDHRNDPWHGYSEPNVFLEKVECLSMKQDGESLALKCAYYVNTKGRWF